MVSPNSNAIKVTQKRLPSPVGYPLASMARRPEYSNETRNEALTSSVRLGCSFGDPNEPIYSGYCGIRVEASPRETSNADKEPVVEVQSTG